MRALSLLVLMLGSIHSEDLAVTSYGLEMTGAFSVSPKILSANA